MFISFSHFRWRDQKDQIQIICVSLLCSLCSLLSNPSSAFLFNTTSHAPMSVENETRKAHRDQKRKEKKNDAKIIRLMEEYISNLKFAVAAAALFFFCSCQSVHFHVLVLVLAQPSSLSLSLFLLMHAPIRNITIFGNLIADYGGWIAEGTAHEVDRKHQ